MFQVATAFELHIGSVAYTLSAGWGTASVPGHQLYVPLFGLFNQKSVGAQRYGVVILGFYITLQVIDIMQAAADVQRKMTQVPTGLGRALRNSTAVASASAMPPGSARVAMPKPVVKSAEAKHIDVV